MRPIMTAAWAAFMAPVERAQAARDQVGAGDDAAARHRVRAEVAAAGCPSQFLAEAVIAVLWPGVDRFADAVEEQFARMRAACKRRVERAAALSRSANG